MALAYNNLRVGRKYTLTNYGETHDFQIIEITSDNDFLLKDLNTLEIYPLSDLTRYGIGKDYDLREL